MKKILLLLALIIPSISPAQFTPMLDEDNVWSVDVYYEPFDPPNPPYFWIETEQISLGEIEVVNNLDYYRIMMGDQETCLLREENGIVYKYDTFDDIDRVLFDFNLEMGDTFDLINSAYSDILYCILVGSTFWESQLIVESVEYLMIAGEIRKVITFEEYNALAQYQWIEGIGNITGFDLMAEAVDITGGSLLVCFTNDVDTYYFNDATSCDNTTLGVDDILKDDMILYPNPVTDSSILQFSNDTIIDLIRIFDLSGKLIKEESISKDYFKIDAMQYPSGLYFYQVLSEGVIIATEKFIVK